MSFCAGLRFLRRLIQRLLFGRTGARGGLNWLRLDVVMWPVCALRFGQNTKRPRTRSKNRKNEQAAVLLWVDGCSESP
jgi:hypothetical protein